MNKPNGQKLDEMIAAVAQKMGKSPEALTQELQSGSLPQNDQIKELLGDKAKLDSMLKNPQVQQLLQELQKK